MASAARAYATQPAQKRKVDIRVVPGRRSENGLAPSVLFAARAFMIILAVFACVACVRIGLASATVTTSLETEQLNTQVEAMRSGSAHLEVAESSLANPASVKEAAVKHLGMSAPFETTTLNLKADVVVFDSAGNLSLARSLSTANQ